MLLWQDFRTQADRDLRRSCSLFEEKDYGFSAYCCQQALEKYVKAYLLKYDLLKYTARISHLDMSKLFKIVNDDAKKIADKYGDSGEQIFSEELLIGAKKKLQVLLEELQPRSGSDDMLNAKIQLWNFSMNVPIDPAFDARFNIKKENLLSDLKPIAEVFQQFYQERIEPILEGISKEAKQEAALEYVLKGGHIGPFIAQVVKGDIPHVTVDTFNLCMIALFLFMNRIVSPAFSRKQKEFLQDAKNLYLLSYPYNYYEIIIKMHPHEDIGRYPTQIGQSSSLDLYPKYAENLSLLIDDVKRSCFKINNAIEGKWDSA